MRIKLWETLMSKFGTVKDWSLDLIFWSLVSGIKMLLLLSTIKIGNFKFLAYNKTVSFGIPTLVLKHQEKPKKQNINGQSLLEV